MIQTMKDRDYLEYIDTLGHTQLPPIASPTSHLSHGISSAISSDDSPSTDIQKSLETLKQQAATCVKCSLNLNKSKALFGQGNTKARLMFIEDNHTSELDLSPQSVQSQKELLTKMISAMGYTRDSVYITSLTKCLTHPQIREGSHTQICSDSFLFNEINLIKPKCIVLLGSSVAQTILESQDSISNLRSKIHERNSLWGKELSSSVKIMATYDTLELTQTPEFKKLAWEDLQIVMKHLN